MKIFSSDTLKVICVNNIKKSKSVVKPAFSKQIKQKVAPYLLASILPLTLIQCSTKDNKKSFESENVSGVKIEYANVNDSTKNAVRNTVNDFRLNISETTFLEDVNIKVNNDDKTKQTTIELISPNQKHIDKKVVKNNETQMEVLCDIGQLFNDSHKDENNLLMSDRDYFYLSFKKDCENICKFLKQGGEKYLTETQKELLLGENGLFDTTKQKNIEQKREEVYSILFAINAYKKEELPENFKFIKEIFVNSFKAVQSDMQVILNFEP